MCWVVARVGPKVLVKKAVVVGEHVEEQFALVVDVAHKGRTCSRGVGSHTVNASCSLVGVVSHGAQHIDSTV